MLVPANMSMQDAAAIPAVYLTCVAFAFKLREGSQSESILIQAVAGGVGLAAFNWQNTLVCTFGTASSSEKLAAAKTHRLDVGINYVTNDFGSKL